MDGVLDALLASAGCSEATGKELLAKHCLRSSLGHPFLLLSQEAFLLGQNPPNAEELAFLLQLLSAHFAKRFAAGCALLADFEGEMPGFGGELATAAFLETAAVTPEGMAAQEGWKLEFPGLLLDLRCESCVQLMQSIMKEAKALKILWGGNGDLASLMHQKTPRPLSAEPCNVLDAQLAFSPPQQRLGMHAMLRSLPPTLTQSLPQKEQVDFDALHAQNRKCMPLPMSPAHALYAVDDLHRIQVILLARSPPQGSYAPAMRVSEHILEELRTDPFGLKTLQEEMAWLARKKGVGQASKAVQLKRHFLGMPEELRQEGKVKSAEGSVDAVLAMAGVIVPADLSWAG